MNLSSALSPTPTRNNRDRRALSAVTAAKIWNGHDHEDGRYGGLRARRRQFLLCFFSRDVNWVTWSSRMAYIARRTRDKAAFLAPLTPCGQQKGAKRQFSPFFADFDQKTQKLHQNKPGIGIAHRFYIEKGITGVISGEVFFYRPPLAKRKAT